MQENPSLPGRPAVRPRRGLPASKDVLKRAAIIVLAISLGLLQASAARAASTAPTVKILLGLPEVEVGDRVPLRIVVEGKADSNDPVLPEVSGLEIVFQGHAQSVQIINLEVKSSRIFNYVVIPAKTGEFTIGPAQLEYGGKTIESEPVKLKVSESTEPQQAETKEKSLIIEASVDNTAPYLGQQITLVFRFARSPDARIRNAGYDLPDLPGFWNEGIESRREYSKQINGKDYVVTEVAIPLFPIMEGDVTIGPIIVRYDELVPNDNSREQPFFKDPFGRSIFDDDFFKMFRSDSVIKRTARTTPIRLRVKSLPQDPKPVDFEGGVGKFSVTARLNNDEIKAGESVTLTVALSGEGNIRDLADPKLELTGAKVYPDNPTINVKSYQDKIVGEKVYKLAIVPQQAGMIEIPEISIPYFNPDSKRYEFASSNPIELKVLPSEKETFVSEQPDATGKDKITASARGDILPVHERIGAVKNSSLDIWLSWLRPVAYPLPLLLYALSFIFARKRERLKTDEAYRRARFAVKNAEAALAAAGDAFNQKDWSGVFSKSSKAICEYLAGKINVPSEGLTPADVKAALYAHGVAGEMVNEVTDFLEFCDFGRFTSSKKSPAVARECLEKAYRLLGKLEQEEAIR